MKISIGCDHRGFTLKTHILQVFAEVTVGDDVQEVIEWSDCGSYNEQRTDYPIYTKKVCDAIIDKQSEFGILICGSGIGMSIAANRNRGIYAALCWAPEVTEKAYVDDNANILVLAADFLSIEQAVSIVQAMLEAWAKTPFKGGRYQERLDMIDK